MRKDWKSILIIVLIIFVAILIIGLVQYIKEIRRVNDGTFGVHESIIPLMNKPVHKLILVHRPLMITPWLNSFRSKHSAVICVTDNEYILLDIGASNAVQLYFIYRDEDGSWMNVKENLKYTETGTYDINGSVTILDLITKCRKLHQSKTKPFHWLNNNCHHETAEIIRSFCIYDENDPILDPPTGLKLIGKVLTNRV